MGESYNQGNLSIFDGDLGPVEKILRQLCRKMMRKGNQDRRYLETVYVREQRWFVEAKEGKLRGDIINTLGIKASRNLSFTRQRGYVY